MKNKLLIFTMLIVALVINLIIAPFIMVTMIFTDKFLLVWHNSFIMAMSCFIKFYYDVKIHIENEDILEEILDDNNNKKNSMVISNHLSHFDFLYLFNLIATKPNVPNNNFKLASIYYTYLFPGIGILCYLTNSMLISDNKKKSLANIEKCKINSNDVVLLYPEGFIYRKGTLAKSNDYCIKNNIELTKNCLYPRNTGLNIIAKNNNINTLYSICMQFDKKHTKELYSLFETDIPNRVYMKFNKTKTDNPDKDTINIFRNMDTYLEEPLNKSKYNESNISLCEKICLTLYTLFFILCMMQIIDNKYILGYLIVATMIYYSYLAIDIVLV